jgi:uncharacterized protein
VSIPRYLPEQPLPPYAYWPGRTPHPTRDPDGHSYRAAIALVRCPDQRNWRGCREYLYGIDLFNHGYYWEAHEAWESLWHACGRSGVAADFLRALIRLAACGFKAREGRDAGRIRHATAAVQLFAALHAHAAAPPHRTTMYFGLPLEALVRFAERAASGENLRPLPVAPAEPVFVDRLLPILGS